MKGPKQSDLFLYSLRRNSTVQKNKRNIGFSTLKRGWDRNRSFVRIRLRRPTSAQLSRAVKADEISVVEPTQPLRLALQSKEKRLELLSHPLFSYLT